MTIPTLHKEYISYLDSNFNADRAVKDKAYLYSEHKHYGLSSAQMGTFFKLHQKEIQKFSKSEIVKYVKYFWSQPSHEEKTFALFILNSNLDKLDISDMPMIEKLMRESKGWVYLDSLVIPVMPVILKKDKKAYEYLHKWIKDEYFWVRRSALLAQLLFFRKDASANKELFFNLAESQFDEGWINEVYADKLQRSRARFFIRKAIGWVLRDMSKKDPKSVKAFLAKNKGKMSGLSYNEGSKRL